MAINGEILLQSLQGEDFLPDWPEGTHHFMKNKLAVNLSSVVGGINSLHHIQSKGFCNYKI